MAASEIAPLNRSKEIIHCPRCNKETAPITVETDPLKVPWFLTFGIWPSPKRRDVLCSKCGKTFHHSPFRASGKDRVIGWILAIFIISVLATIALIIAPAF